MKRRIITYTFLSLLLCSVSASAADRASDREMMEFLKLSGAVDVLMPMMDQLVIKTEMDIRQNAPNLPEDAFTAIGEELQAGTLDMVKKLLATEIEYYEKKMTRTEILALSDMFRSQVWKKYIDVSKQYMQEEYQSILQVMIPQLSRDLQKRVHDRLVADGYFKAPEETL